MDKRVSDWIDANGRRFVELKLKGGDEYFKINKVQGKLNSLEGNEWIEFFMLLGQLDGIMHALEPEDAVKASSFHRSIKRRLKKIEAHCLYVYKLTGKYSITITEA